ncbi:MAG: branched-chain amino acid ABC transporter permease [Hyphomicrobiaceae bacterium]
MAIESLPAATRVRLRDGWLLVGVVAMLALVPLISPSRFYVNLAVEVGLLGLWAASLNVLIGFTGLVSFGHAAFFGLGVYTTGLLIAKLGLSMAPALLAGVAVAAVAALLVGIVIVRLSGIAFALVTLAFSMMVFTTVWRWSKLTGGDDGLTVSRPPLDLGVVRLDLQGAAQFYYLALVLVLCVYLALSRFLASPVGAALQAVRQNAVRAESIGIDVHRHRLLAFVVAGATAGLAGSLYVLFRGFAAPDLLHWSASGQVLLMTILGGIGTLYGPFLGAAVFVVLQEVLSTYTQYWMLPLGIIFILAVRFMHGRGLLDLLRAMRR